MAGEGGGILGDSIATGGCIPCWEMKALVTPH